MKKTHSEKHCKAHYHADLNLTDDQLKLALRQAGLKATPARMKALSIFMTHRCLLSIDEILSHWKGDSADWSTVFRTTQSFIEAGLIDSQMFEGGLTRYEFKKPGQHHHHLICLKCHKVEMIEVCPEEMIQKAARKTGFVVIQHRIEASGVCKSCSSFLSEFQ